MMLHIIWYIESSLLMLCFFAIEYPLWYTHQLTFIHWYDCLCCQLMNTYGHCVAEGLRMSLSGPMLSNYVFPCVPYPALLSVDKDILKAGFRLDVLFITPLNTLTPRRQSVVNIEILIWLDRFIVFSRLICMANIYQGLFSLVFGQLYIGTYVKEVALKIWVKFKYKFKPQHAQHEYISQIIMHGFYFRNRA